MSFSQWFSKKSLIRGLVSKTQGESRHLNSVVSSKKGLEADFFSDVKKMGMVRGRDLFFPYISSGKGKGPYVELKDGSVKMDLVSGIGVHILGHGHPLIQEAAIKGSLKDTLMQGNLQMGEEYYLAGKKLTSLASRKSQLRHCWITNSGSMANENALKICRQKKKGAPFILSMKHAFAGRTVMMSEITDNPAFRQGQPSYREVLRVPFFDKKDPNSKESLKVLKDHIRERKGEICAFVSELILGEGGYVRAPRDFFAPLFEECKKEGIPVWLDEIQTFCRTGEFFCFETLNLGEYVDVCTVAKAAHVGATLYTREMNPRPGLISGTFSGTTPTLQACYDILCYLEKGNFMGKEGKVAGIHKDFKEAMESLRSGSCKGLIKEVGGMGLMCYLEVFQGEKEKTVSFVKELFENGIISFGCGKEPHYRVRFLLPVVLTKKHIEQAQQIIEKTLLRFK